MKSRFLLQIGSTRLISDGKCGGQLVERVAADQLQPAVAAAAVLCHARFDVDVDALCMVLQNDVHHAGDGIRAVDRRGAAFQNLDAIDCRGRDVGQVHEIHRAVVSDRVIRDAPAIDQDEGMVGAEPPQADRVGRRCEGIAEVRALGETGVLRQACSRHRRRS